MTWVKEQSEIAQQLYAIRENHEHVRDSMENPGRLKIELENVARNYVKFLIRKIREIIETWRQSKKIQRSCF